MEPEILQLIRYGQIDETLKILNDRATTRKNFQQQIGSYLQQFIGLAARHGSIEILKRCLKYGVSVKIGSKYGLHAMVGAASRGHDHVIEWLLEPWVENGRMIEGRQHFDKLNLPQAWLYPSLHKAIQGQHVSTVKLLVERAWADVNACDNDNLKPLHVAADPVDKDNPEKISRYEEIVDILVIAGARVTDFKPITRTTPLYDAVSLNSRGATKRLIDGGADIFIPFTESKITVLHIAATAGFQETLRTMLNHDQLSEIEPCDFDVKDENGRTPLHAAVYGGHLGCVRTLIKKGLSLTSTTTGEMTVLAAIFEHVPNPVAFLAEILDEQVTMSEKSDSNIIVDFRLLVSKHSHEREHQLPDMNVVVALINGAQNMEQRAILQHPMVETFLRLKYLTAMPYDVLVLLLHLLFAGLLWWQVTHLDLIRKGQHVYETLLTLLLGFYIGFENIGRTFVLRPLLNFDKLNMYLLHASCCMSIMSLFFEVIAVGEFVKLHSDSYNSPAIVYLSSIMVLCSWINVTLLLIRFPLIGEYSFMFFSVLMKIGKVLLSFTFLITGFILSLSILFVDSNRSGTLWKTFAKTLVMMTGEYDHNALFPPTELNNSSYAENDKDPLRITSMIVFLVIALVFSIALINLMVGLSVNNIQELLKEGQTRRLMQQANTAAVSGCSWYFTKSISSKINLNLNSSSWISYIGIPAEVKKSLYKLAFKNLNRDQRSQIRSSSNNREDNLAEIKSLQQKMAMDLQRLTIQMQLMMEDSNVESKQSSVSSNYHLASKNTFTPYSQERNDILAIDYKVK